MNMNNDFRLTTSRLPSVQSDAIDILIGHLSPCPTQTPYRIGIVAEGTALAYEIPEPEMRAALGIFLTKWRIPTRTGMGRMPANLGIMDAGDMVPLWTDLGYALDPEGFREALVYLTGMLNLPAGEIPRNLPVDPYEAITVVRDEITAWYDAEVSPEVRDFLNLGPAVIAAIYVWAQRRALLRMEEEMGEIMLGRAKADSVIAEVDREVEALIPLVCESVDLRKWAA